MAGLIAAVMSHVSGAINSCTTIATMDVYLPYIRPQASEAEAVRFGRIMGIVFVVVGIFWAGFLIGHSERPIFIYLMDAYGYFAPGIATMFLLGIFWKRTTHAGALAAGLLTIPMSVFIQLAYPSVSFANRTGIVFWTCVALCTVVSLFTRPKPAAELAGMIWDRQSLSLPASQQERSRGLRSPLLWWAVITAVVLFFYASYP
jgi:solute:Na+ symporter, SSS family